MGLKLGICGTGNFAQNFIQLFRAHPLVEELVLCDLKPHLLAASCERHGVRRGCTSLEELLDSDVDAVALFTQNWLHGPQALQVLQAGKQVYSAVPSAITLEEMEGLVREVERSGLVYMLGETSYYYPAALYCRKRLRQGDFGPIVYGEAEYYHDWDHGLYEVMQRRGGEAWRGQAGLPPMLYPTHSVSMIVSVTGARMTQVASLGYRDRGEDGIYRAESNPWGNPFSNQSALFRMSDGSVARINEFRRIGHSGCVRMRLYGTRAGFEEQAGARVWVDKARSGHEDVEPLLKIFEGAGPPHGAAEGPAAVRAPRSGLAPVHDAGRLPPELLEHRPAHEGSHVFLVDDFVRACTQEALPLIHVWEAARYLVPGLMAHCSAMREGAPIAVPDFGDPPAGWRRLKLD